MKQIIQRMNNLTYIIQNVPYCDIPSGNRHCYLYLPFDWSCPSVTTELWLLLILLSPCHFKPLPRPTGRASHDNLFSLSTLYSLPTISLSLLDLFEGVLFNSIAVENRIIVGCMQKSILGETCIITFFCFCCSSSYLCWRRGFSLEVSNNQKLKFRKN